MAARIRQRMDYELKQTAKLMRDAEAKGEAFTPAMLPEDLRENVQAYSALMQVVLRGELLRARHQDGGLTTEQIAQAEADIRAQVLREAPPEDLRAALERLS
jgi:hypothetical protein